MSNPTPPNPPAAPSSGRLLDEFPPVRYEDWRKLVEAELKGAPFDKRMFTSTYEGITLRPIYTGDDSSKVAHMHSFPGFAPFVRGSKASGYYAQPWLVSQEIAQPASADFNSEARTALSRGATALNVVLDKATRNGSDPDSANPSDVGCGGLSIATLEDVEKALDGIEFEKTPLFVRSGASAMPFAALLVALLKKRGKTTSSLRGCIEMDPLGILAHEGKLPQSLEAAYAEMETLTRWASQNAPQLQTICVHSRPWHESGANAVQELAYSLATAVEYLRVLTQKGMELDVVAPRLRFAITVSSTFFTEISKLRALRLLWSRVISASGGNEASQRLSLHVRTSHWNKTTYDPHNNMLRATVEALAAVLGSCDSLQVGAFDEVIGHPDELSQRVARNTQLVLQKECYLDHVIDPAGGSWYVENLTAELAQKAWALFQEIEKQGGMAAALKQGNPQKAVAAMADEKIKNVMRRRDSVVGINQYANVKEKALTKAPVDGAAFLRRRVQQVSSHRTSLEDKENRLVLSKLEGIVTPPAAGLLDICVDAVLAGATLGEITRSIRIQDAAPATATPVCITRAAAPLESLRSAMDQHSALGKSRPKVFLCNMGPLAQHKARADFSRSFFAVGGYEVSSPKGFATPEEAAEAFGKAGASIAVICSTDDTYPALVPALAQQLRGQNGNAILVLAGYPQDQLEAHKQAGITEFIHIRANVYEVLKKFHTQLGIIHE
jgi:methylmalonyl-CoA mutase